VFKKRTLGDLRDQVAALNTSIEAGSSQTTHNWLNGTETHKITWWKACTQEEAKQNWYLNISYRDDISSPVLTTLTTLCRRLPPKIHCR